ncbi:Receptor-type tyrosine-protein phosphatase F [Collichthys lucidus]|uniref:Receptor-type tyrosine-protein phosphatase F n=1 Tax=Collichthys lucidus TaxID=240159 RepID=A0A4U5UIX4_COLLU|nr:Receptor-type tyrosine-protein phosphatase F [Collichthys lucidus]
MPSFIKSPDDQTGISGGVASFVCQAVGEPKPRITWMKKGKKVSSQRFEVIEFDDGSGSVLRIQPLRTHRDEAIYECTATNSVGEINTSAKLTVLEGMLCYNSSWYSIVLSNVRALWNKVDLLHAKCLMERTFKEACIIALTETWLDEAVPDIKNLLETLPIPETTHQAPFTEDDVQQQLARCKPGKACRHSGEDAQSLCHRALTNPPQHFLGILQDCSRRRVL